MWRGATGRSTCWRRQLETPVFRLQRVEREVLLDDERQKTAAVVSMSCRRHGWNITRWNAMDGSVRQDSNLKEMRSGTRSQWRLIGLSAGITRSHRRIPSRAAAFWTDWRHWMRLAGSPEQNAATIAQSKKDECNNKRLEHCNRELYSCVLRTCCGQ